MKIRRGLGSNGYLNRGRPSARWLVVRLAHRSRRAFGPVPGGVSGRGPQSRPAQQVVSRRHEVAPRLCPLQSPIPAPSKSAHRLEPTKYLFDPFAQAQADLITRLPGGAPVQADHLHLLFADHLRGGPPLPTTLHKRFLMTALVGTPGLDGHSCMQLLVGVAKRFKEKSFLNNRLNISFKGFSNF